MSRQLNALIPIEVAAGAASRMLGGVDLSGYALDEPMPDIRGQLGAHEHAAELRPAGAPRQSHAAAGRDALGGRQGPLDLDRHAEEHRRPAGGWFVEKAADGFNLLPPHVPGAINEFVDLVVPGIAAPRPVPHRI